MNDPTIADTTTSEHEQLTAVIGLAGRLPALWRALDMPLSEAELTAINDSNGVLLNAIAVVDSHNQADPDESGAHSELLRIEAKVDLLLGLVTRVLSAHQATPTLFRVFLSAQQLSWQDALVPVPESVPEQLGVVDLYVYPLIAVPLTLPLRINSAGSAQIIGLNLHTLNGLEKFLFRQHRRAIAGARQLKSQAAG